MALKGTWSLRPTSLRVAGHVSLGLILISVYIIWSGQTPGILALALGTTLCVLFILFPILVGFHFDKLEMISKRLNQQVYKQLLKEYVRFRPEKDAEIEERAWETITENINKYVIATDFDEIDIRYSRATTYSVAELKGLFKDLLKKSSETDTTTPWGKISRAVVKLRKQDLTEAMRGHGYEVFEEVLDLSEDEKNGEQVDFELVPDE